MNLSSVCMYLPANTDDSEPADCTPLVSSSSVMVVSPSTFFTRPRTTGVAKFFPAVPTYKPANPKSIKPTNKPQTIKLKSLLKPSAVPPKTKSPEKTKVPSPGKPEEKKTKKTSTPTPVKKPAAVKSTPAPKKTQGGRRRR